MTPDGLAPDLGLRRISTGPTRLLAEGRGLGGPSARHFAVTDRASERTRQVCIALQQLQDELLRAHVSTVLAMGRFGRDDARMIDALAEARRQHEALFLVRRAVDALMKPGRPAGH